MKSTNWREMLLRRWDRWWKGYAEVDDLGSLVVVRTRSPFVHRAKSAMSDWARHPMIIAVVAAIIGTLVVIMLS